MRNTKDFFNDHKINNETVTRKEIINVESRKENLIKLF